MIETALKDFLATHCPLATGGVHPPPLPQNPTFPLLTYFSVSGVPDQTHEGPSGLILSRFQINCWDREQKATVPGGGYIGAKNLANQVCRQLDGFHGMMGIVRVDSVDCVDKGRDLYNPEMGLYQVQLDFLIGYSE